MFVIIQPTGLRATSVARYGIGAQDYDSSFYNLDPFNIEERVSTEVLNCYPVDCTGLEICIF